MSFIYKDQNLLEQLFRIAQAAPAVNPQQLNQIANSLIDGLKASVSPIRASDSPKFSDLADITAFTNWLKTAQAQFNGALAFDQEGRPNKEAISAIISDLRDKAVGKEAGYSEAISNIIEEANRRWSLVIKPAATTPSAVTSKVGPDGKPVAADPTDPKHPMVNVKLNSPKGMVDKDGNPIVDDSSPTSGSNGAAGGTSQLTSAQLTALSNSTLLLNGTTVDFEAIVEKAKSSLNFLSSQGTLHTQLRGPVSGMSQSGNRFDTATSKSPNVGALQISSSENERSAQQMLSSTFQSHASHPYTEMELATICRCYYDLMQSVQTFFGILASYHPFTSLKDDFTAQLNMARDYAHIFLQAEERSVNNARNTAGGMQPR